MEHTNKGFWLDGRYYVHSPKTSSLKDEHKKSATKLAKAENASPIIKSWRKVSFKIQGKINGIGTTPSMQLSPPKPTNS